MGLEYQDLAGQLKPTIYFDEFESKIGQDDQYIVLSFYVHNEAAANDLVNWFEGYEFVIDADKSPGEIEPNHYLVFVEIKRRTQIIEQMKELIEDFESLSELKSADWIVFNDDKEFPLDDPNLESSLVLSPLRYREMHDVELNEMLTAANVKTKTIYENSKDKDIQRIRRQAGLL